MSLTIFLAKFWGSLFMILGGLAIGAGFLRRVIGYTEDKTVTIATGYITMLLALNYETRYIVIDPTSPPLKRGGKSPSPPFLRGGREGSKSY